ncbi:hypothetical protein HK096_006058, partial [Nowakowskiella sp. JEL0078]
YPCPVQYNPADHIMDIVQDIEVRKRVVEAFTISDEVNALLKKNSIDKKNEIEIEDEFESLKIPKFATGFWTQLRVLFYRTALNKKGLLAFPAERVIINKERASGSYRISTYFLAKTMAETPLLITLPTTFILITYWMAGLNPNAGAFFGFLFIEILAVSAGEGIGLFVGTVSTDIDTGMVIATVSLMSMLLVGGFFAKHVPVFLSWLKYLSLFYYAFNACQTFELSTGNVQFQCDPKSEFNNILPSCSRGSDTVSGDEILKYALGAETNFGFTIGLIVVIWVVFRVAAYLTLRYVKHGINRSIAKNKIIILNT